MYNVLNFLQLKSLLLLVMLLAAADAAASTPAPSTSHPAMPAAVADSLFDAALPQVEVLGKTKRTVLKPKAKRLPAVVLLLTPNQIGQARSADIFIPRPFNLEEISFTILSNTIPGAVMSVEIYRDTCLSMPISSPRLITIPQAMKQEIGIQLEKALHLSPGTYRLLLRFVECDSVHLSQSLPANSSMSSPCMKFPLYLKQSRQAPSSQDAFDEQNIVIPFKLVGYISRTLQI
ncbi:MAG: hypothetical protein J6Q71_07680 [Bacteroidales bacterium]|nr:hypothetical protein [Bacteroidales bacterium]